MSATFNIQRSPDFIEAFCHLLPIEGEELQKILYYDCKPFVGIVKKPVSGTGREFSSRGEWLEDLACRDLFAVQLGRLNLGDGLPEAFLSHPTS